MAQNPCDNRAADGSATTISLCRVNTPDASTQWFNQQVNEVSAWGASIETTARQPLSLDRSPRKGTITSMSAEAGFTSDQFLDNLAFYLDALVFSQWKGANPNGTESTGVTSAGYVVASGGAEFKIGDMVFATGFANPSSNGIHVVDANSTNTVIGVTGLTDESGVNARIYKAGHQFAIGSIMLSEDGNLESTSSSGDFMSLGLIPGQHIYLTGFSDDVNGMARVRAVTSSRITLDNHSKKPTESFPDTATLYFGSFVRSVSIDSPDYQCVPFTGEARYNTNPPTHEYARGMLLNQIAFNNSLEDKTTLEVGFICSDVEAMTTVRLPGVHEDFERSEAFNTSADFSDLKLYIKGDESGDTTYFKDTTLTVNNNMSGESVLGKLGPEFINLGDFNVTIDTQVVLTDPRVASAIRNNTTCGLQYTQQNNEGGIVVDIPSMTLGDGAKNIAANEKVKLTTTGSAFLENEHGYVIGFSLFPYLPR